MHVTQDFLPSPAKIIDLPELRDRLRVFPDRAAGGERLAEMLAGERGSEALVVAIPAGGVPVAAALVRRLGLPPEVAPTSKILIPGTTEAGYGAVAWDGTVVLNEALLRELRLSEAEVGRGVALTRQRVARRVQRLRAGRPPLALGGRTAIVVDDGLASGFTMLAAAAALRGAGAGRILVAVPTAHQVAAARLARVADGVYCANLRVGQYFAIADAYENWHDVSEEEALETLEEFRVGRAF